MTHLRHRPRLAVEPPVTGSALSKYSFWRQYAVSCAWEQEVEVAINSFAADPGGGLVVMPHPVTLVSRDVIIGLAARHRLPAVYPFRFWVRGGGLVSYGIDQVDHFRRIGAYIDRILKGAKPADLPTQASTKFELAVNLKTAKALGLTVPPTLLARADEVIE
jgi:putative ABC transport system substrate-binding protein